MMAVHYRPFLSKSVVDKGNSPRCAMYDSTTTKVFFSHCSNLFMIKRHQIVFPRCKNTTVKWVFWYCNLPGNYICFHFLLLVHPSIPDHVCFNVLLYGWEYLTQIMGPPLPRVFGGQGSVTSSGTRVGISVLFYTLNVHLNKLSRAQWPPDH